MLQTNLKQPPKKGMQNSVSTSYPFPLKTPKGITGKQDGLYYLGYASASYIDFWWGLFGIRSLE